MLKIYKNIGYSGISQFLYTALAFVLLPFAARYLNKDGYGIYSLAAAIGFFVSLLSDFGLTTLITREVAKNKRLARRLYAHVLGLKFVLVVFSLVACGMYLALARLDRISVQAILIFVIVSLLGSFAQSAFAIFRGFEEMQYESLAVFIDKSLSVILGITLLLLGFGIRVFLLSFLVAGFIKITITYIIVEKKFLQLGVRFSPRRSFILFRYAVPFGISIFLAVCYNYLDVLMLSAMRTFEEVGIYSAGHKLLNLTSIVPSILVNAFFPQLAVHHADRDSLAALFMKGSRYLMLLAIPMIPFVFLFANPIVSVIFGQEYTESIWVVRVLVFAAFAQMLNTFFVPLYAAVNQQQKIVNFQLVGLTINAVLNAILIPVISYKGASMATVATEGGIFILILWYANAKIINFRFAAAPAIRYFLKMGGSVLMMVAVIIVAPLMTDDFVLQMIAAGIVYFIGLQITGVLNVLQMIKWIAQVRIKVQV